MSGRVVRVRLVGLRLQRLVQAAARRSQDLAPLLEDVARLQLHLGAVVGGRGSATF